MCVIIVIENSKFQNIHLSETSAPNASFGTNASALGRNFREESEQTAKIKKTSSKTTKKTQEKLKTLRKLRQSKQQSMKNYRSLTALLEIHHYQKTV